MARSYARIYSSIWTDRDFIERTASAQRLYLLAVTQPNVSYVGVLPFTSKRWAGLATDTKPAALVKAMKELIEHQFMLYDDDTDELLIRSFIRNDGVLKSPNMCVALAKDYCAVLSPTIRKAIRHEIPEPLPEPFAKGFGEGFPDNLPEPFRKEIWEGSHACAPALPLSPPLQPQPHSHSQPLISPQALPVEDANDERDPRVIAAVEALADEDLANAVGAGRVRHTDSYRRRCIESRWDDDGPGLTDLAATMPDATTDALIRAHAARTWLT